MLACMYSYLLLCHMATSHTDVHNHSDWESSEAVLLNFLFALVYICSFFAPRRDDVAITTVEKIVSASFPSRVLADSKTVLLSAIANKIHQFLTVEWNWHCLTCRIFLFDLQYSFKLYSKLRICNCFQGVFDSLRYDEAQPDYQQKLLDVSHGVAASLYLKRRNKH